MKNTIASAVIVAALLAPGTISRAATITIQADKPGHKVAPTLWGIFFEDINLSADGGLYPELVRNRSFEDAAQPDQWKLSNHPGARTEMTIDSTRPLNPMNRHCLRLNVDGTF